MKLLTKELLKQFPALYSQDGKKPEEVKIASAPLMLEALEAVEELNYRSDETDHNEVLIPVSVLEKVIQAIAKAKGVRD